MRAVKRSVKANVPMAEYGPCWSASVIDLDHCFPEEAALRVVEDVSFYDQEACFSAQRAFVAGCPRALEEFRDALRRYFELFSQRHRSQSVSRDVLANRAAALLEARYIGGEVEEGFDWAVIVASVDLASQIVHPLARTLLLHHVESISRVAANLDARTQTLGVFPWEQAVHFRDKWARAGVDRLVPLGWARLPRAGWTHDAGYGMHQLVRLVSLERPRSEFGKHYPRPANPETWERSYLLGEPWAAYASQTPDVSSGDAHATE